MKLFGRDCVCVADDIERVRVWFSHINQMISKCIKIDTPMFANRVVVVSLSSLPLHSSFFHFIVFPCMYHPYPYTQTQLRIHTEGD